MSVYRFRVSLEDNEEVYREIEIKSLQNFEEFHTIILQSVKFDSIHNASFFISDDYWRKGDEISLKPISETEENKRKRMNLPAIKLMSKCKMASLIDDPHQKFVYVYDPAVSWTFLVELVKILPDDAKVKYPRIAKSVDDAPVQYNKIDIVAAGVEDDLEDDLEDEVVADDEAYASHDDDDIVALQGEEGEEILEEEEDMDASDFEEHTDEQSEED